MTDVYNFEDESYKEFYLCEFNRKFTCPNYNNQNVITMENVFPGDNALRFTWENVNYVAYNNNGVDIIRISINEFKNVIVIFPF